MKCPAGTLALAAEALAAEALAAEALAAEAVAPVQACSGAAPLALAGGALAAEAAALLGGAAEPLEAAAAALVEAARGARAAAPPRPLPPELQVYDISLTYGELQPASFMRALALALPFLRAPPPHAFLDFGSGEGFPPLLAAALHGGTFSACSGVEISPRLHAVALEHAGHAAALAPALPGLPSGAQGALQRVALHCGDGLAPSALPLLHGAALLYMNSTAFGEELLAGVFRAAEGMRAGALVVCTSQVMMTPLFELCAEACLPSTWGSATVRVYRRNKMPRWVVGVVGRKAKS
jgi:hypothetical protein